MSDISKRATARFSGPRGVGSIVTVALPLHASSPATAVLPDTEGPECRDATSTMVPAPVVVVGDGDLLVGMVREPQPVATVATIIIAATDGNQC